MSKPDLMLMGAFFDHVSEYYIDLSKKLTEKLLQNGLAVRE